MPAAAHQGDAQHRRQLQAPAWRGSHQLHASLAAAAAGPEAAGRHAAQRSAQQAPHLYACWVAMPLLNFKIRHEGGQQLGPWLPPRSHRLLGGRGGGGRRWLGYLGWPCGGLSGCNVMWLAAHGKAACQAAAVASARLPAHLVRLPQLNRLPRPFIRLLQVRRQLPALPACSAAAKGFAQCEDGATTCVAAAVPHFSTGLCLPPAHRPQSPGTPTPPAALPHHQLSPASPGRERSHSSYACSVWGPSASGTASWRAHRPRSRSACSSLGAASSRDCS